MVLKPYRPRPVSTAGVRLGPDLRRLIERLAVNAHEVWAKGRLGDGWRYGPRRSDALKRHPCLVPYDDLPASEKAYDRRIVTGTLKAAIAFGFRISKPAGRAKSRRR